VCLAALAIVDKPSWGYRLLSGVGILEGGRRPDGGFGQPCEPVGRNDIRHYRNGKADVLKLGDDAFINVVINPADTVEAPLVFAGYGLTVPELRYDDLAGLDSRARSW
jgi:hypothetical protein